MIQSRPPQCGQDECGAFTRAARARCQRTTQYARIINSATGPANASTRQIVATSFAHAEALFSIIRSAVLRAISIASCVETSDAAHKTVNAIQAAPTVRGSRGLEDRT